MGNDLIPYYINNALCKIVFVYIFFGADICGQHVKWITIKIRIMMKLCNSIILYDNYVIVFIVYDLNLLRVLTVNEQ